MIGRSLFLLALPAIAAAEPRVSVKTSQVWAEPSESPGAWVDVWFDNQSTNGPADSSEYSLGWGIAFLFTYTPGPDTVEVIPPPGYVCAPSCSMTLPEGSRDRVTLYSLEGVGM